MDTLVKRYIDLQTNQFNTVLNKNAILVMRNGKLNEKKWFNYWTRKSIWKRMKKSSRNTFSYSNEIQLKKVIKLKIKRF